MANDGFGLYPKIKLDGEADFKKAIASVNKDLNVLSSEMKLSTATFGDNNESMTALTAKAGILNEQMEQQTKKVETLREAVQTMKDAYGENSDKVKEWQVKLNNAETQLLKTKDAIEKNQEAIEELSKKEKAINKIKDTFSELKEKAENVSEKLEPAKDKLKSVASVSFKGFTAGVTGAAAAVTALNAGAVKAAQAVFSLAQDASGAADEIDKASIRMGVSAEEYQKLSYAAGQSGVAVSTLEAAAKQMQKDGNNMDLTKALKQVASIKDESERTAAALEMFGSKAGYQLAPLLAAGSEGIEALTQNAEKLGLVMSNEAVTAGVVFGDTLDDLKNTASALKNNLTAELLPGITTVMEGVTGLMTGEKGAPEKIKQGIAETMDKLDDIIPEVLTMFNDAAPVLADAAVMLVGELAGGLLDNSDQIIETAGDLVTTLGTTILEEENLEKIINSGIDLIVKLAGGLLDATPNIVDAAFMLIDGLMGALLDEENMDDLVAVAVDLTVQIAEGLIGSIPELVDAAFQLAGSLVEALLNYDWSSVGSRIWSKIKTRLFGDAESEGVDGSHAVGLSYVPYDNYIAELHKGERILTAAENEAFSVSRQASSHSLTREDVAALRSDLQAIANILSGGIGVDINNTRDLGRAVKQSA